jgi:hypothetical protein
MDKNTISAWVPHFSVYGILGRKDNAGIATELTKRQTKITSITNGTILFSLECDNVTTISLYNSAGRLIKTLYNSYAKAGIHCITFGNEMAVSNGHYFVVLKSGQYKRVVPYVAVD